MKTSGIQSSSKPLNYQVCVWVCVCAREQQAIELSGVCVGVCVHAHARACVCVRTHVCYVLCVCVGDNVCNNQF
jgi:hypothetical protein